MMNWNTQHCGPGDLLREPTLTTAEKREILASWASDARAVPNAPSLRQLETGEIINVDDVLKALRTLDTDGRGANEDAPAKLLRPSFSRNKPRIVAKWPTRTTPRRDFDDDDPPPCPATAAVPTRRPVIEARAA